MKKAIEIAKEFNVGLNTLGKYFDILKINLNSPNQKVSIEDENNLRDIHNNRYYPKKNKSKRSFKSKNIIPEIFNQENPFKSNTLEIIQEQDIFQDRQYIQYEINGEKFKTIFSDFEAFTICKGLEGSRSRLIARNYFKDKNNDNIIEAHKIAERVLKKYGTKYLTFIISLPLLPINAFNPIQIFNELDKRKNEIEFPILRITYKNSNGKKEKIQISYYRQKDFNGSFRNENIILVKNKSTGKDLMRIDRKGNTIPENITKDMVPIMQLFVRFSKDTKKMILNYGLETRECSICGRELTDKTSIRKGIGPICQTYI